ncbi:MAG: YybH family protein [Isosphaerales bacterium]
MRRVCLMFVIALAAAGLGLGAQEVPKKEPPRQGAGASRAALKAVDAPRADRRDDEQALKALVDTFIKAFNTGNADAAAATYTQTAMVVAETGERIEGRAGIKQRYAASFADNPGSTIAVQVDSLRFLGAETALEEGHATITPAKAAGAPEITRFTAVYVKQDGHWLQAAVRDEPAHDITPHDRLKELEWLVGEWVNESQDAVVFTTCKWADGGNFLVREFTMKTRGEAVLSGSQRIGWDPVRRQFKTWIFDTEGGHAEGYWARNGDQWVIKAEGVRQDGLHASATNIITRLGKDRLTWQSVDRTLGGAAIPGIDEFTMVRKPPEVAK